MFKSLSTSLILRGILAVAVGIMALAWPQVTVLALVILFAVYAFIAAGLEAMRAFSSPGAGPVFGHLLLGLVDLAAGVVALAWPGPTALVLVLIVGTLDTGRLGIVVLGVPGDTSLRPGRAWTAPCLEVSAPAAVLAGVDGEAVDLSPPLRFAIRPAALRVRISSRHPGASPSARLHLPGPPSRRAAARINYLINSVIYYQY